MVAPPMMPPGVPPDLVTALVTQLQAATARAAQMEEQSRTAETQRQLDMLKRHIEELKQQPAVQQAYAYAPGYWDLFQHQMRQYYASFGQPQPPQSLQPQPAPAPAPAIVAAPPAPPPQPPPTPTQTLRETVSVFREFGGAMRAIKQEIDFPGEAEQEQQQQLLQSNPTDSPLVVQDVGPKRFVLDKRTGQVISDGFDVNSDKWMGGFKVLLNGFREFMGERSRDQERMLRAETEERRRAMIDEEERALRLARIRRDQLADEEKHVHLMERAHALAGAPRPATPAAAVPHSPPAGAPAYPVSPMPRPRPDARIVDAESPVMQPVDFQPAPPPETAAAASPEQRPAYAGDLSFAAFAPPSPEPDNSPPSPAPQSMTVPMSELVQILPEEPEATEEKPQ
jgi:hypothetical protein